MMPTVDMHIVAQLFLVALLGGLIGLDRTAAGQFMISQPIVAGPLTGWVLGDATAGLVIGAVLELIWVLDMPIGTFVPADATIGTVSATAVAALGSAGVHRLDLIGFSILLTTVIVPITMKVDGIVRTRNSRLVDAAQCSPGEKDGGRLVARAHLTGLMIFFVKSFVLYLLFIPAGLAALRLFERMPDKMHGAMVLFVKLLPLLGAALVVRKLSIRTMDRFFLAGFILAAFLTVALHVPALVTIVLVVAAGFFGNRYREGRR